MDFVLIPGAWMGAWVWEPVARGLRELGHGVRPVTLSGLADEDADVSGVGLETHVEDVLSILKEGDLRRAVLVGHSYSGIVAGQVADRAPGRVAHTVFIDAFLPRDGRALLDAFPESQREDELRQISENGGRWPAPDAAGLAGERDLSAEQRRWLLERFVGHPGRTVSEPATLSQPLAEQRATYVACAFEIPDDVALMSEGAHWTLRKLDTGHWPMVSAPARLVALLAEAASEQKE